MQSPAERFEFYVDEPVLASIRERRPGVVHASSGSKYDSAPGDGKYSA